MSNIDNYEVVVGNIGLVHAGPGYAVALEVFNDYKTLSEAGRGRAAGEAVTLFKNGEPFKEFYPEEPGRFQTLTLRIRVTYDMQTVKVSELSGAALNWAVAKCLEVPVIIKDGRVLDAELLEMQTDGSLELDYATDWAQGGPIIEREWLDPTPWPNESQEDMRWHCRQYDSGGDCAQYGPTLLIAGMRCYVASKLGDTIEIPEELLS